MNNFHISSNGKPAPCKAEPGKCPLTEDDGQPMPHFRDEETAYSYIEKKAEADEVNSRYGAISKKPLEKESNLELSKEKESEVKNGDPKSLGNPIKVLGNESKIIGLARLKAKEQKDLIENGSDEQFMVMAENIDDLSTTAQIKLLKSDRVRPEHIQSILNNSDDDIVLNTAEVHPSARISKAMSDKRLSDPRAISSKYGGHIENGKNMDKELYDRMNNLYGPRNGILKKDLDKKNALPPAFVSSSLKYGKFKDDEKMYILNRDPQVVASYVQMNPEDKVLRKISLSSGERAELINNLPKNSEHLEFHVEEFKNNLRSAKREASFSRDNSAREELDWRYQKKLSTIQKEASDVIGQNEHLSGKDVKDIVEASTPRDKSEEFLSNENALLGQAFGHPNTSLEDKKDYAKNSKNNLFIDSAAKNMFRDDENPIDPKTGKERNKNFNYDESKDSDVQNYMKKFKEDSSGWSNKALSTKDPSMTRAMILDGGFWKELSQNKNLSDVHKGYVSDHHKWRQKLDVWAKEFGY